MTKGMSDRDQGYPQPQGSADQEEGSAKSTICCLQGCLASTAVGFGFLVALPSGILLVIYAANRSDVTLLSVGGALLALPFLTLVVVVLLCFNQRRLARLRKNRVTIRASASSSSSYSFSSSTSSSYTRRRGSSPSCSIAAVSATYATSAPAAAAGDDSATTTSSLSSVRNDCTETSCFSSAKDDSTVKSPLSSARDGSVTKLSSSSARDDCSTSSLSSSTVSSFASLSETNSATPLVGKSSAIRRTCVLPEEEGGKAPLAVGPNAARG